MPTKNLESDISLIGRRHSYDIRGSAFC